MNNQIEKLNLAVIPVNDNHQKAMAEKSRAAIIKKLDEFNNKVSTIQEFLHSEVLIPAVCHAFMFKDCTIAATVLNSIMQKSVKTIRVESVQYWLSEFAGFKVTLDKEVYHCAMNYMGVSKAETLHTFTYDKDHLNLLKNPLYRYWKVAPVEVKILKAPEIASATETYEKSLAKAILLGADMETIQLEINSILTNAMKYTKDKKVQEWFINYNSEEQIKLRKEKEAA